LNEKALEVLEFGKVLDRLAAQTSFSASRDLALALRPTADVVEVARQLRLTTEARRLLDLRPNASVGGARDVRSAVQRAALGGVLDPQELLEVRATLETGQLLRTSITRLADEVPTLADLAQTIVDRPALAGEIARCINERAEVADAASATLAQIRGDVKIAYQRLTERLNDIISSATYRPYIQDAIITIRDGRYVIPIKADAKGHVRGIVHDQSSSGQTVFIEPLATVDLNNRWRQLQIEEQHEVARILRELSSAVAAGGPEIIGNVVAIAEIDFALAKARYAILTRSVEPELSGSHARGLRLVQARHTPHRR
jgi:DNA mismatch repair protein MutS2